METLKIDISHLVEPIHIISGSSSGDIYGGWDRHGNTREMQWRRSGGLIDRSTYTFDRAGQRLTRVNSTSGGLGRNPSISVSIGRKYDQNNIKNN